MRLCGALMPWSAVEGLEAVPSGLYRSSWQPAALAGRLEVVDLGAVAWFDCGTPTSYLAANLWVSGGRSVIGAGATVDGVVERSVLWPGTTVAPGRAPRDRPSDASDRVTGAGAVSLADCAAMPDFLSLPTPRPARQARRDRRSSRRHDHYAGRSPSSKRRPTGSANVLRRLGRRPGTQGRVVRPELARRRQRRSTPRASSASPPCR